MLVKYAITGPQGVQLKQIQRIKELLLYARFVVKTTNAEIYRGYLQKTARSYAKARAACAARLFFTIQPIKFLICDVVIPAAFVMLKIHIIHIWYEALVTCQKIASWIRQSLD